MTEEFIFGIDISKWQKTYAPTSNSPLQIDFVIQRLSYVGSITGKLTTDEAIKKLTPAVLASPIKGCFHYVGSKAGWKSQADYFIDLMNGMYDFWAWDVEKGGNNYSFSFIDGVIPTLKYIYEQTKKPGLLYLNPDIWGTWYKDIQDDIVELLNCTDIKIHMWVACYFKDRNPYINPHYWEANNASKNMPRNWKFWQYDDKGMGGRGKEFGVESLGLDLDRFNGSRKELMEWIKPLVTIPPSIEPPIVIIPPVEQPQEGNKMNTLDVKYVSQIMGGALEHNNDCGSASSLMMLRTYNLANDVTVDQFYNSIKPSGDYALSAGDMQAKMTSYGLKNIWKVGITIENVFGFLQAKKPLLALIHYAPLVDAGITEKKGFRGAHFIVITGIDLNSIYINDPYRTDGKTHIAVSINTFKKAWDECVIDGNPTGGAIIPVLSIQDLSVPVSSTNDEYYIISSVNGLNVRIEPIRDSALVRTIWRSNEPVIHAIVSSVSGEYIRLTDLSGYVYFAYLRKK